MLIIHINGVDLPSDIEPFKKHKVALGVETNQPVFTSDVITLSGPA